MAPIQNQVQTQRVPDGSRALPVDDEPQVLPQQLAESAELVELADLERVELAEVVELLRLLELVERAELVETRTIQAGFLRARRPGDEGVL